MASLDELIFEHDLRLDPETGSVGYTLAYPVGDVSELTLRRPRGGDLIEGEKARSALASDCIILAKLSGQDVKFFKGQIDAFDLQTLREIANAFPHAAPPQMDADLDLDVKPEAGGGVTIKLAVPVMSEGEEIDGITLRRPNGADMDSPREPGGE